ncbi:MAG: hypothetical protein ACYTBX_05945 [Planctomycetota bacterium]|jgi:hypothetical protein
MNFWIDFWSWFFFLSLAIFAILAVVVSVGGFFNILSLFKTLTMQRDQEQESTRQEDHEQT